MVRSRFHLRLLAVGVLLVASSAACGRKAPPRAPEDVLPRAIADLSAGTTAAGIELAWSRPSLYTDGSPMPDLGGFVIERASGTDPAAPFRRVAVLEVGDRDRFRQIKRFRHIDHDTDVGIAYRYRVVSFTLDRYFSAASNVVTGERSTTEPERHAPLPAAQR